jgi:hypothetical protein
MSNLVRITSKLPLFDNKHHTRRHAQKIRPVLYETGYLGRVVIPIELRKTFDIAITFVGEFTGVKDHHEKYHRVRILQ